MNIKVSSLDLLTEAEENDEHLLSDNLCVNQNVSDNYPTSQPIDTMEELQKYIDTSN